MAVREFLLPDLGEGLEDAEVVSWHVAVGDRVELNQVLVEVNTAKAVVEIPSPWEGVVDRLHAGEGDVVQVGKPLISIRIEEAVPAEGGAAESAPTPAAEATAAPSAPTDAPGEPAPPRRKAVLVGYGLAEDEEDPMASLRLGRQPEQGGPERRGPVPASPPVRRLAKDLGVDLAAVTGTGPGGRVTREDVVGASQPASTAEAPAAGAGVEAHPASGGRRVPVRGTRRLIAERMTRSIREIPQVTTFLTLDASQLLAFRDELVRDRGGRLSPLPIVVAALAETCRAHPELNASFDAQAGEIVLYDDVHVGIATDTERGLLVPVVRDAGGRGIADLAAEIGRLTEAARAGSIGAQDLQGSTITVTNVGTFGAEYGTPILNPPEAAILALGVIEPRAQVVDGQVEARPAVTLSLTFDHRVLDGAAAGRAARTLGDILESPFKLGALPR
jgi:2-oxoisovalerate dehydrogenase E2 component (dihydrolipoyl transacylase)